MTITALIIKIQQLEKCIFDMKSIISDIQYFNYNTEWSDDEVYNYDLATSELQRFESELKPLKAEYSRIQSLISRALYGDAIALVWVWYHAYELIKSGMLSQTDWDAITCLYYNNIDHSIF